MGMFDYIKCEVKLPGLPSEFSEYRGGKAFEILFQTKDTPNQCVSTYKICANRTLYVENNTWLEPVIGFTGDINFYDYWEHPYTHEFGCKDFDAGIRYKHGWIEYKASFINGLLDDIIPIQLQHPSTLTNDEVDKILADDARERKEFEETLIDARAKYPSAEHMLIDKIDDIITDTYTILDEDDFVAKLNSIEDLIKTYRENHDRYYRKNKN